MESNPVPTVEWDELAVLRTPLLPFAALTSWGSGLQAIDALGSDHLAAAVTADLQLLRERLVAWLEEPGIEEALLIASPSLSEGLDTWRNDPDSANGRRAERALVRYLLRATTRPTPFGLFAGCSLVASGPETRLQLAGRQAAGRHTSLDNDYLYKLAAELERLDRLGRWVAYHPNTSLYPCADGWRYAVASYVAGRRKYELVGIEHSPFIEVVLANSTGGATIDQLADALVAADPDQEIEHEAALGFLAELIEMQVIVPASTPRVTGAEPLDDLVRTLRDLPGAGATVQVLEEVQSRLHTMDAQGLAGSLTAYEEIATRLAQLPTPVNRDRLFRVDLLKPADLATLGPRLVNDLGRAVLLLHQLGPGDLKMIKLDRFRSAFQERFGSREVPLQQVLDEDAGIGYERSDHPGAQTVGLLEQLYFKPLEEPRRDFTTRDELLLARLHECWSTDRQELALSNADVGLLRVSDALPMPGSVALFATIAAAGPEALAADRYQVFARYWSGPSGANLIGRFCHSDPALEQAVRAHLAREQAQDPDAIYAEIVHLPQERIGNLICRPVLRSHEIVFLARSGAPADRIIELGDLMVSVSEAGIHLRSQRLDRRVIPRLTSAHNYGAPTNLAIYRFLCSLQGQGCCGYGRWNWGALERAPFLPRVRVGNIVLSRAKWNVTGKEISALLDPDPGRQLERFHRWREDRGMPRFVQLVEHDNELTVDLHNLLSIDAFAQVAKGNQYLQLCELFPDQEQLCVTSPEGALAHELVVPFIVSSSGETAVAPVSPAVARVAQEPVPPTAASSAPAVRRVFPPQDEWLFVKLYTSSPTNTERVLLDPVAGLVQTITEQGLADRWFFLRYRDPELHLRLRFHGRPEVLWQQVYPGLQHALSELVEQEVVHRIVVDTYERELERYGGPGGIELSETVFHHDSNAVLALLDLLAEQDDPGDDLRWRLALVGSDLLLQDMGLDLSARHQLLRLMRDSYHRRFKVGRTTRHQLGDRFRQEHKALRSMVESGTVDGAEVPGMAVLRQRSLHLRPVFQQLHLAEAAGRLSPPLRAIASSYVHMYTNRLLRAAAVEQELVIYDLLLRLYDSALARQRTMGADND